MSNSPEGAYRSALTAAETLARIDRRAGKDALGALFCAGGLPEPQPEAFHSGHFAAFLLPPGLEGLALWAASTFAPWLGKTFDAGHGANVVRSRFLPLGRLIWPFYRHYVPAGDGSYRAFPFRTYAGAALLDPGVEVLKIDYDLPENPRFVVRRVLDEIVQLEDGLYLGRWHFRRLDGSPQLIAYFVLYPSESPSG